MDPARIASTRLASQQLARPRFTTVPDVVAWMGAMQAQDPEMSKWAIGTRLAHTTAAEVQAAIDRAEIVRTHLLRPTWHLVAAQDVRWMLEFTAPHISASLTASHRALGLTARAVSRTNAIIEKSLTGGRCLPRRELLDELRKNRIPVGGYRAGHILLRAELDGVICSGPANEGKPTYALLDERVPGGKSLRGDRALKELAGKYFTSRSPATLGDFMWWSGLPAATARRALEMTETMPVEATAGSRTYWIAGSRARHVSVKDAVHVLPAFDEFLISYKDRSAVLPAGRYAKVVSSNGIFRPVIVVDGLVAGLWKRTKSNDVLMIGAWLFKKPAGSTQESIERAFARYAHFTGTEAHLTYRGGNRTVRLR
jgi:hypothetical protein